MSQLDVYRFLRQENDFRNVNEIGKALDIDFVSVRHSANKLVNKGQLIKQPMPTEVSIRYGGCDFKSCKFMNYYKIAEIDKEC